MQDQWNRFIEKLGLRLKYTRQNRGMTMGILKDIARESNVVMHPSYLSRVENGKLEISLRNLVLLTDYYEISLCNLLEMINPSREIDQLFDELRSDYQVMRDLNYILKHSESEHLTGILKNRIRETAELIERVESSSRSDEMVAETPAHAEGTEETVDRKETDEANPSF